MSARSRTQPPATTRASAPRHSPGTARFDRVHAELFAAGPDDPRARRPSDLARAIAYLGLLGFASVLFVIARDVDANITRTLTGFPRFLRVLWLLGVWGAGTWTVALLVIVLVRRRARLAAEALLAAGLAILVAAEVAELVGA